MSPILCPSILSLDPANYAAPVAMLADAGADVIHLDVMDGQFVPPITFGADLAASLNKVTRLPIEAHLMTRTPESHFESFVKAGCSRIIFHTEASHHSYRLCQELRSAGVEAGVAINPGTPIEDVLPLLDVADMILVMTVNPGWGGQELIESCIEKVIALRRTAAKMPIEVDGGIDPSTIGSLWKAGATHFVTGSYLTRAASHKEALRELRAQCH